MGTEVSLDSLFLFSLMGFDLLAKCNSKYARELQMVPNKCIAIVSNIILMMRTVKKIPNMPAVTVLNVINPDQIFDAVLT